TSPCLFHTPGRRLRGGSAAGSSAYRDRFSRIGARLTGEERSRSFWHAPPLGTDQEGGGVGRLDGKVALITGAASGMGKIAGSLFATEGARVVLADVADEVGRAAADEVTASGGQAVYVHADVSKAEDAQTMVRTAMDHFGSLTILYNNAGIFPTDDGSLTETTEDTWDRVMDINLKGVFLGCKYGIPAMIDSG